MKAKQSQNTLDLRDRDIEHAKSRSSKWLITFKSTAIKVTGHKKTLFAALAIIAMALGLYTWYNHKPSATTGEAELKVVKSKLSRHFLLPNNEVPALATITDTRKLTSPFFKGAKNGDQVLIYQKNHIVIIYRPSIDRIVSVGPVTIDTPHTGTSQTTQ